MPAATCICGDCAKCKRNAYMSEWYRRPGNAEKVRGWVRRYREKNAEVVREKDRARGYRVYDAAKVRARALTRTLDRQPCSECGAEPADAHHPDYTKPLEVVWLCRKHHGEAHRKVA